VSPAVDLHTRLALQFLVERQFQTGASAESILAWLAQLGDTATYRNDQRDVLQALAAGAAAFAIAPLATEATLAVHGVKAVAPASGTPVLRRGVALLSSSRANVEAVALFHRLLQTDVAAWLTRESMVCSAPRTGWEPIAVSETQRLAMDHLVVWTDAAAEDLVADWLGGAGPRNPNADSWRTLFDVLFVVLSTIVLGFILITTRRLFRAEAVGASRRQRGKHGPSS
jgi:ABC-type Fe3+ transport system substrate-binding protein